MQKLPYFPELGTEDGPIQFPPRTPAPAPETPAGPGPNQLALDLEQELNDMIQETKNTMRDATTTPTL